MSSLLGSAVCNSESNAWRRRFFETEGITILTMLVSRYRIELKDEPEFAHETMEEKKARILTCRQGVTTT